MPVQCLCLVCRMPFTAKPAEIRKGKGKYCSTACFSQAMRRRACASLEARFWSRVSKTDTCWLWTGRLGLNGYGTLEVGRCRQYAHRIAYELTYGPLLPGLHCLHHCDTPACVRPAHLFLGTHDDNMHDMARKKRHFSHTKPERLLRGDQHHTRQHPEWLPRGTQKPNVKLTEADVREIRRLRVEARMNYMALARAFSVSRTLVRRIIAKTIWTHVT